MMFRSKHLRRPVIWVILLCLAPAVEAAQLYRYRNADGVVVVGYQVPVDAVAGGYEVLNKDGMVVKVVPRELTSEERKEKDAEARRDEEARAEQERLREWDESLMLRYSTVADIEDAQHRALGELQIRMSILRGNRRALKQRVENYQAQAADLERAGKSVDVERLRTIEGLQDEIAATERDITERQREIEVLEKAFEADIERFNMLRDVVELRQSLSTNSSKSANPK
jgi:hypothetical protein